MKIIQNALIGGTNGDMAFKYNNHFVRELFDNFEYTPKDAKFTPSSYDDDKFRAFLYEILHNEKEAE